MENTSENKEKNTKRQITEHLSIGLLAHVDAGKTTLSEAVLYLTGSIRRLGRVDNRDAFLDTYEQERARGITIFSKQAVFPWGINQSPSWTRRGMWIFPQRWSELSRCWTTGFS